MSNEVTPLSLLIAYPYFKDDTVELLRNVGHKRYRLIVDSGAFTAWNTGRDITLDNYCRFLDTIEHIRPFHAVQLDVFGDPEGSFKNLLIMRERGYEVMPVFTRGDSLDQLEHYYSLTDYIMFGGIVIGGANQNYVKWFLNRNKGRKAHWLGFTNVPFMKAYKPESVDSSSWTSSARFGSLALYMGFGKLVTFQRQDFIAKPKDKILEALRRVGIDEAQMRMLGHDVVWSRPWQFEGDDWSKPARGMAQFISTLSHLMRSYEFEKKLGTKIYLAGNVLPTNKTLFWAQKYLMKKGLWK